MNFYMITSLMCATTCLLLAFFSFLMGSKKTNRLLAVFNLAVAIWSIGSVVIATAKTESVALLGWKLSDLGGFFLAIIYYHLVTIICEVKRAWIVRLGYLYAILFEILNFSTNWMMDEMRLSYGFFFVKATPLLTIATIVHILYVSIACFELFKALSVFRGERKKQILYFLYAFGIGFVAGTTIVLPQFGLDWIYPCGNLGVFIYAGVITYAVLKEKVLDVETIVKAAHRDKLVAIGTMATSINHEIRNPLYVIKGLADSHLANIEDGIYQNNEESAKKANEVLEKTSYQAERAIDIMKRFAMFAKRSVNQEAKLESVQLKEILAEVQPLVHHELELDKIHFVKDVPQDLSPINVDRRHLEEVLFNLIVNACQAMKENNQKGQIKISAAQHNGSIKVKVEDDGPGMEEEQIKQIFNPFYTTKQEGTGLGLYVTKQLVERNGGKIAVSSKLGKGTQFSLEFKR